MRHNLFVALGAALLLLAPQLRAETVTLDYRDLQVSANLETASEEWQQTPVLLITHGTLAHNGMEIITTMQERFAEAGYSSLAINLSLAQDKRSGMYDCASEHRHRHSNAILEIDLWEKWLRSQGVQRIVLIGHSRGGNQTAWYAAEQGGATLQGAILVAPQTWDYAQVQAEFASKAGHPLDEMLTVAEQMIADDKGDEFMPTTHFVYCADAKVTANSFADYYRDEPRMDTPSLVEQIPVPVLVFAGSEDTVVPGLAEKMEPLAEADKAQFVVIDGADHFFRDLYMDDLVDEAVSFIESLN